MTNTDKVQWKTIAVEGVAIVISILLAFWIDTWWEGRVEAQLEVVYLAELQEDFELNKSRLNENFSRILIMTTFFPIDHAYTNMTGSGDLKLIQDRSLKNALAEYYAAAQIVVMIQNTHEMELVQTYEPYIIENLDYAAVGISRVDDFPLPPPVDEASILKVLSTREFRNILVQKMVITTDLLDQLRMMLERTNNILNSLGK